MVRSLPLDVQDNIKSLLKSGHSYSSIIKRLPGAKKSHKSEVTATTKSYIRRSVITGKLKTGKDVQRYLCDLGCAIGYSACLKFLKSMEFQARIKKHKPFLKAIHMKKRLAWANAHKDWTNDDWRCMVFSDEPKRYDVGCITYDDSGYACGIYDGAMKKEDYVHILDTTLMGTLNYYNYDPENIYFQQITTEAYVEGHKSLV
ncbi:hypothetical protein G6F37_012407 [Rhizopus arrhizus]|nr:hypothetical protein G6F38_012312 [Rhizopus arrhizus]KAG1143834.1 hypothetical protein G6F37_012407 [Rhizopus arrhizus]